jgi:hypothetical protein
MSNLLNLSGGIVRPNGVILQITVFKELWKRDVELEKNTALNEFAYIYAIADWKSEYIQYGIDMEAQIGEDIFGNRNYKPDELVLRCIDKYKELQVTPSLSLIDTTMMAVNSIKYYFEAITINPTDSALDKKVKLKEFDLTKVLASIQKLGAGIDALNSLYDKVKKEEKELNIKIRGGGIIGIFEDSAPWLIEQPK